MKVATVGLTIWLCASGTSFAQSNPHLQIRYDKFKDATIVLTKPSFFKNALLGDKLPTSLKFVASYVCKGNTTHCEPAAFFLIFTAVTSTWAYHDSHDLVLIVGPERIAAKPDCPPPTWQSCSRPQPTSRAR
jgi:hypothetical protein